MTAASSKNKKPRKYVPHDVQAYRLLKNLRRDINSRVVCGFEDGLRLHQIDRVLANMEEAMTQEPK